MQRHPEAVLHCDGKNATLFNDLLCRSDTATSWAWPRSALSHPATQSAQRKCPPARCGADPHSQPRDVHHGRVAAGRSTGDVRLGDCIRTLCSAV